MDQKGFYVIYKAIINDEGYNGYAMLFHHCEDIKILGYTDTKEKAERTVLFLRHDPTRDIISDDKFWNKKEQENVFYFYQKAEELAIDDCYCYRCSGCCLLLQKKIFPLIFHNII